MWAPISLYLSRWARSISKERKEITRYKAFTAISLEILVSVISLVVLVYESYIPQPTVSRIAACLSWVPLFALVCGHIAYMSLRRQPEPEVMGLLYGFVVMMTIILFRAFI